ncbi:hypothetical protein SBOR_6555 [Sclerotinia borealis F-4128]|uniref:Uncharacterized protein n=1 Tax=Sclerotinia borealis (strain F-4128) TaxID=1432307 RepID=W9CEU3_SCLBF|nr:hypothetical protein SBOR_6555 [Sclerotinia borealis F-4128]
MFFTNGDVMAASASSLLELAFLYFVVEQFRNDIQTISGYAARDRYRGHVSQRIHEEVRALHEGSRLGVGDNLHGIVGGLLDSSLREDIVLQDYWVLFGFLIQIIQVSGLRVIVVLNEALVRNFNGTHQSLRRRYSEIRKALGMLAFDIVEPTKSSVSFWQFSSGADSSGTGPAH